MDRWKLCSSPVAAESSPGATCYGGLDLSQTRDLTAFVLVFPSGNGEIEVICRFWAPAEGHWRDEPRNKDLYALWARQGFLKLTPGEVIDYSFVEAEIVALAGHFDLKKVYADRAMALHLCLSLRDTHGLDVDFLPQVPMHLNGPIRELERLVLEGSLRHGGNPVLAWCASNVSVRENATGLLVLDKARSTGRIDGIAALVNAIAAMSSDSASSESVYEKRGILFI
jgi:phage terminase large subunit-like protein